MLTYYLENKYAFLFIFLLDPLFFFFNPVKHLEKDVCFLKYLISLSSVDLVKQELLLVGNRMTNKLQIE